jgi:integrase
MIADGLCRNTVNQRINKVRYVFKWAAENELIDPSVYHGLTALSGLRRGRSEAVESEPVKPVAPEHARAIKSHVSAEVGAMIELQLLTGMRPGEVCIMRGRDLETASDDLWLRIWTGGRTGLARPQDTDRHAGLRGEERRGCHEDR